MNVFLTGQVQTGKSTAIRRFLARRPGLRVGGFVTVSAPVPEAGGSWDVYILPPDWTQEMRLSARRVGRRGGERLVYPAVFDTEGVALLRREGPFDLLLMDELGRMELGSPAFCAAVLSALDGETPVLGVVKPESNALLDAVRAHPRTLLLSLTPENRDGIPARIAAALGL